jgi:hypothetical protein
MSNSTTVPASTPSAAPPPALSPTSIMKPIDTAPTAEKTAATAMGVDLKNYFSETQLREIVYIFPVISMASLWLAGIICLGSKPHFLIFALFLVIGAAAGVCMSPARFTESGAIDNNSQVHIRGAVATFVLGLIPIVTLITTIIRKRPCRDSSLGIVSVIANGSMFGYGMGLAYHSYMRDTQADSYKPIVLNTGWYITLLILTGATLLGSIWPRISY